MEHPGLELAHMWDANAVGRSLTFYVLALAPVLYFFFTQLPVNVLGQAVENDPSASASAAHMETITLPFLLNKQVM